MSCNKAAIPFRSLLVRSNLISSFSSGPDLLLSVSPFLLYTRGTLGPPEHYGTAATG